MSATVGPTSPPSPVQAIQMGADGCCAGSTHRGSGWPRQERPARRLRPCTAVTFQKVRHACGRCRARPSGRCAGATGPPARWRDATRGKAWPCTFRSISVARRLEPCRREHDALRVPAVARQRLLRRHARRARGDRSDEPRRGCRLARCTGRTACPSSAPARQVETGAVPHRPVLARPGHRPVIGQGGGQRRARQRETALRTGRWQHRVDHHGGRWPRADDVPAQQQASPDPRSAGQRRCGVRPSCALTLTGLVQDASIGKIVQDACLGRSSGCLAGAGTAISRLARRRETIGLAWPLRVAIDPPTRLHSFRQRSHRPCLWGP